MLYNVNTSFFSFSLHCMTNKIFPLSLIVNRYKTTIDGSVTRWVRMQWSFTPKPKSLLRLNDSLTCVFDYNSGDSWSILILFVPVERRMNALQIIYLIPWWRHKYVTSHVIKVYFIELLLNIKCIEFWRQILDQNLWKCERFSAKRLT